MSIPTREERDEWRRAVSDWIVYEDVLRKIDALTPHPRGATTMTADQAQLARIGALARALLDGEGSDA